MGNQSKRFLTNHRKASAAVVTIAIHALFVVVSLTFVAVQVYVKPEQTFEVKEIKRPKMQLRKLQVPVQQKRAQLPKLRQAIVTKPKANIDITIPEIVGIKGGTGYGSGSGLSGLGFGLDINLNLFGSDRPMGNELVGTFYDLKQTPDGESTEMTNEKYFEAVRKFAMSFRESELKKYYKAPKQMYSTCFVLPDMPASMAPEVFEAKNVQPIHWLCHYKGSIAAPETGYYRFWGIADNILIVRVKNRLVLDASDHKGLHTNWTSDDPRSGKFPMDRQALIVGDWIKLEKGEPVDMDLVLGEFGGLFHAYLLVEQKGKDYRMVGDRPVLPVFKTAPIPENLAVQMKLDPDKAVLDGSTFGARSNSP